MYIKNSICLSDSELPNLIIYYIQITSIFLIISLIFMTEEMSHVHENGVKTMEF